MPVYVQHELLGKVNDVFCADAIWQPSSLSLFSRRPLLRDLLERAPREHRGRQPTRCFAHVTVLLPQDEVDDDRHLTRGARVRDLADGLAALHRRDFGDLLGADEVRYQIQGSEALAPGEVEVRFGHAIYLPGAGEQPLHDVAVSRDGVVWNPVCAIYPDQRLAMIGAPADHEASHPVGGWPFPGEGCLLLINDGPDAPVEIQARPKGTLDCRFDARQDCHLISQPGVAGGAHGLPARLLLRITRRMARLPSSPQAGHAAARPAPMAHAPMAHAHTASTPHPSVQPSTGMPAHPSAKDCGNAQSALANTASSSASLASASESAASTLLAAGSPAAAPHPGTMSAPLAESGKANAPAVLSAVPAMLTEATASAEVDDSVSAPFVAERRRSATIGDPTLTSQAVPALAGAVWRPRNPVQPAAQVGAPMPSDTPPSACTGPLPSDAGPPLPTLQPPDPSDATYAPVASPCRVVLAALALPRLSRYLDTGAHELAIGLDPQLNICPEDEPPALTLGVDRDDRMFAETAAGRQQIGTNAIFTPFARGRIELRDAEGLLAERYIALLRLPHTPDAPLPARVRFTFGRNAPMLEQLRVLDAERFLRAPDGTRGSADRIGLSRQAFSFEALPEGYAIRAGSPNQALYHLDEHMRLLARIDQLCQDAPYLLPPGHHLVAGHYVLRFEA